MDAAPRLPEASVPELIRRFETARAEAVQKGEAPLLAFDADGTIWRGDVGVDLFDALLSTRAIKSRAAEAVAALAARHGVETGSCAEETAKNIFDAWEQQRTPACPEAETFAMMAWIYAGFTEPEIAAFAEEVLERAGIAARIRPEVRSIVAWAHAAHVEVVVASASPKPPVVAGVRHLGIAPASVFALTPRIDSGIAMPELSGVFVYAEGKATALRQGRPGARVLGAFGDSAYDAALLRLAVHPVAVAPSRGLREVAASIDGLVCLRP